MVLLVPTFRNRESSFQCKKCMVVRISRHAFFIHAVSVDVFGDIYEWRSKLVLLVSMMMMMMMMITKTTTPLLFHLVTHATSTIKWAV